jgi:hypothetical protein
MQPTLTRALKTELVCFISFYLLVCIFILAFSPPVHLYVGHDLSLVIDGAWRIENHQIPHKDFSSILGSGYLLQQYLFLKMFNYDFIAFAVSSITITTAVFIVFLSFYSSQKFLQNTGLSLRIYLFLLLVSLGLGQYHLGVGHTLLTYANLYNRYCFLCLLILFLQVILLKDEKVVNTKLAIQLIIAGVLINYLLFVKLTYFIVAIGFLTTCLLLSLIPFKIYVRILLAGSLIFAIILWVTQVDFIAIIEDYRTISQARGKEFTRPVFFRDKLLQYYNLVFLLSLGVLTVQLYRKKAPVPALLLIGVISISGIFLQLTNWGSTDIVLLAFVPLVFILLPGYRTLLSFRFFVTVCCFFILKNMRSIYFLTKAKGNAYTELKSVHLSRFYTNFTEVGCKEDYAIKVMSGVALINRNKTSNDKVFSFSFDNPFSFLTHTIPPKHVPIVWQYATTYTHQVYTAPEVLFSDVDLILIPTCLKAESATEMMDLYGTAVTEDFRTVDSNHYWTLYRKRQSPGRVTGARLN